MKNLFILLIGALMISCNQTKQEDVESTTIEKAENFDWLVGKWQRLNEEEGKETFENWDKINESEYTGIGFTMQHGDTIKQEKIRLTAVNGNWNLNVKTPDEYEFTTFAGISHNENEFTCGNDEIDFPNRIKYLKNGERLNAIVSSKDMAILFEFEKLDN